LFFQANKHSFKNEKLKSKVNSQSQTLASQIEANKRAAAEGAVRSGRDRSSGEGSSGRSKVRPRPKVQRPKVRRGAAAAERALKRGVVVRAEPKTKRERFVFFCFQANKHSFKNEMLKSKVNSQSQTLASQIEANKSKQKVSSKEKR